MEYKGQQFHENCFLCSTCNTSIGSKSFIPKDSKIFCVPCYEHNFATKCTKCVKVSQLSYLVNNPGTTKNCQYSRCPFLFVLSRWFLKAVLLTKTCHFTVNASIVQIASNPWRVRDSPRETITHTVQIASANSLPRSAIHASSRSQVLVFFPNQVSSSFTWYPIKSYIMNQNPWNFGGVST